jgi:hypothetical protein
LPKRFFFFDIYNGVLLGTVCHESDDENLICMDHGITAMYLFTFLIKACSLGSLGVFGLGFACIGSPCPPPLDWLPVRCSSSSPAPTLFLIAIALEKAI